MLKLGYCECNIWSVALCGAEIGILRKVAQKYRGSSEMWCWRRMEKIIWSDRVRNEEVLHRDKEQRNIIHTVKKRKAIWIGQILFGNWLLEQVFEGKMEGMIDGTRSQGRRRRQLLDGLKQTRCFWKFEEEALERSLWRNKLEIYKCFYCDTM